MGVKYNSVILRMVVVATAAIIEGSAAETHRVGDSSGWNTPNGGLGFSNWAAQRTFVAGDFLVFDFTTGQHTAAKVSQSDYDNCNTGNPIEIQINGPANFTLTSGASYFMCTTSNHCSLGQKLAVNAAASANSPTTTPAPPLSPTTNTSPSPPPSSATHAAVASASLFFLSFFMAFFC